MPTYYSRQTTIQLSLVDLSRTTTNDPKYPVGGNAAEMAESAAEFARGSVDGTLKEFPVSQKDTQSNMSYLGFDEDMPFFMVHAGVDLFDQSQQKTHTRKPERVPETAETQAFISHQTPTHGSGRKLLENASDGHIDPEQELQGDRRSKQPKHVKPHGLCLTVFLTPDTFLPSNERGSRKILFNDVKIDVFYNGELCGSSFVAERHHANGYQMTEHIVRYSGRRVARHVEKPWVIVPPGQNADGTRRERHEDEVYAGAEPRWTAISEALDAEATRVGSDEFGALSLLGEYLTTLARLAMPLEVEEMQKAGGLKFGVIDVVVIAGRGQKDDSSRLSLTEPTGIRLKANKPEVVKYRTNSLHLVPRPRRRASQAFSSPLSHNDENILATSNEKLKATIESYGHLMQDSLGNSSQIESSSSFVKPTKISFSKPERQQGSPSYESKHENPFLVSSPSSVQNPFGSSKRMSSPTQQLYSERDEQHGSSATTTKQDAFLPFTNRSTPAVQSTNLDLELGPDQKRKKDPSPPPSTVTRPPKRNPMRYVYVLDNHKTLSEEFDSVQAQAKQEQTLTGHESGEIRTPIPRTTRALRTGTVDVSTSSRAGPSKAVDTPAQRPKLIVKLKVGGRLAPTTLLESQPKSERDSTPSVTLTHPSPLVNATRTLRQPSTRRASTPYSTRTLRQPSTRRASTPYSTPVASASTQPWSSPALSQDSALTYAAGNLMRSVKSERNGWFEETDVVMGVRFLIG